MILQKDKQIKQINSYCIRDIKIIIQFIDLSFFQKRDQQKDYQNLQDNLQRKIKHMQSRHTYKNITNTRQQYSRPMDRTKRFTRKPGDKQKSQRSQSKKSCQSSVKEMYIKSPSSLSREKNKEIDFFTALAQSILRSPVHQAQIKDRQKCQDNMEKKKQQSSAKRRNYILDTQQSSTAIKYKYKPKYTERNQTQIYYKKTAYKSPAIAIPNSPPSDPYNTSPKFAKCSQQKQTELKNFKRLSDQLYPPPGYSELSSVTSRNYPANISKHVSRNSSNQNLDLKLDLNFSHNNVSFVTKIKTLQAEIQLKNHELVVVAGEIQRFQVQMEDQREKRKKAQTQKRDLQKQIKQLYKICQSLKLQIKKHEKQKQYFNKQIQFLERISYDQQTRSLQSYRQTYLQNQIQNLKRQLTLNKQQRQQELQHQIRQVKEEKFNIQAHYKALKVAYQCLVKQVNYTQENIHDIVLNSDEYRKLRDKYIKFLEYNRNLRNEYQALRTQYNNKQKQLQRHKQKQKDKQRYQHQGSQPQYSEDQPPLDSHEKNTKIQRSKSKNDSSSIFSITTSQFDGEISLLKMNSSNLNLSDSININIDSFIGNLSTNLNSPINLLEEDIDIQQIDIDAHSSKNKYTSHGGKNQGFPAKNPLKLQKKSISTPQKYNEKMQKDRAIDKEKDKDKDRDKNRVLKTKYK